MTHPSITRINQRGDTSRTKDVVELCLSCHTPLTSGRHVLQLNGNSFCDADCLYDAVTHKPVAVGIETVELD